MGRDVRILHCLSCGNKTPHAVLGRHTKSYFDMDGDHVGDTNLEFVECGTCHEAAVHYIGSDESDGDQSLWPTSADLGDDVPTAVQMRYQQALLVKHALPSAFAVQIRRALEAICTEQGEAGSVLAQRLTALSARLGLPPVIQNIARVARILGNKGAHDGPDVSKEEARTLEEFFLALVEYVYVAPGKLTRYQDALVRLNL